jgi:hypothetical protein
VSISPTQSNLQAAMVAFIATILPGTLVVSGQDNRVPEPGVTDFIVMTPIFFDRIETGWDLTADCRFTGNISGNVMQVSAVQIGSITLGALLFGTGVTPGTTVVSQSVGPPGGPGNYMTSLMNTVPPGTVLSTGQMTHQQNMEWRVQLDFHSRGLDGGDMAATFVTMYRNVFATDFFENTFGSIDALYADEARQTPFINDQQQYEWRWVVEAILQVNQVVVTPQQYMDAINVNLINVLTISGTSPLNVYTAEDGSTAYVAEDGQTFYVQEQ